MSGLGKSYIRAYKVFNSRLPIATSKMNFNCDHFRARVVSLIPDGKDMTIVSVEMEGSYPYITNQWEKFIL